MTYALRQRKFARKSVKGRVRSSFGGRKFAGAVSSVWRGIKPEVKSVDVLVTTNILSTTATFATLNATALGTEIFQRIGRRIRMKSLHLRGQLIHNAAALPTTDEYARLIVFYDKDGTTAALTDILESVDATGSSTSNVYSGLNTAEFSRFKVMVDIPFSMPVIQTTAAAVGGVSSNSTDYRGEQNFNRFVNLMNMSTEYGAGGSLTNGGLQLMTIGSQAIASASYSVRWYARIRYTDL